MTNTLKVIKPFLMMEEGDTFERTDNGMYRSEYNNSFSLCNPNNALGDFDSNYTSVFEISESYAKALVDMGNLAEVKNSNFVNVFDEIENLAKKYDDELDNLDEDMKDAPACLKVEKETVLRNLLKVLEHLHSLKK